MPYHPPSHIRQLAHAAMGEPISHFERSDGSIVIVMRDGRKIVFPAAATCQAPDETAADRVRKQDDLAREPSKGKRGRRKARTESYEA